MKKLFVYVTAANEQEAATIGRACVEKKLAACANILPGMRSIYRWQKKIEEAAETVLILKTTSNNFLPLEAEIKKIHSYECPCICAIEISAGYTPYLNWIEENCAV